MDEQDTAGACLTLAHKFYGENAEELDFTPYEGGRFPVNEIEVFDDDGNHRYGMVLRE